MIHQSNSFWYFRVFLMKTRWERSSLLSYEFKNRGQLNLVTKAKDILDV